MLAVVKTPHIIVQIQGRIPPKLIEVLRDEYGERVQLVIEADELVDVFKTDWYKRAKARLTPGKNLRIYRQNMKMTQAALGKQLGGIPKLFVSNMENDIRPISKKMALKLAEVFEVSVAKFIEQIAGL
jgi:DNA-binding XRE family transcriptional regulator